MPHEIDECRATGATGAPGDGHATQRLQLGYRPLVGVTVAADLVHRRVAVAIEVAADDPARSRCLVTVAADDDARAVVVVVDEVALDLRGERQTRSRASLASGGIATHLGHHAVDAPEHSHRLGAAQIRLVDGLARQVRVAHDQQPVGLALAVLEHRDDVRVGLVQVLLDGGQGRIVQAGIRRYLLKEDD